MKFQMNRICTAPRMNAHTDMNTRDGLEVLQELVLGRIVDPPHHAAHAQEVHREERRRLKKTKVRTACILPTVSFISRPKSFGYQ